MIFPQLNIIVWLSTYPIHKILCSSDTVLIDEGKNVTLPDIIFNPDTWEIGSNVVDAIIRDNADDTQVFNIFIIKVLVRHRPTILRYLIFSLLKGSFGIGP